MNRLWHRTWATIPFWMGLACRRLGLLRLALRSFEWSARLTPQPGLPHFECFDTLVLLDRLGEAEVIAAELVKTYPETARSHYNHGWVLHRLGRDVEALEAFDRALERNPPEVRAHLSRGVSLEYLGRFTEAAAAYRLATRHAPTASMASANLESLSSRQRVAAAEVPSPDAYRVLFAQEPTFTNGLYLAYAVFRSEGPDEIEALLHTLRELVRRPDEKAELGRLLMEMDKPEAAVTLFREASTEDPQNADTLSALASALSYLGEIDEAERHLRALQRMHASSPLAHGTEGIVALRRGDPAAALRAFDRALELAPSDVQMAAFRALALHSAGRTGEAIDEFQRLERESPEFFEIRAWSREWREIRSRRSI